MKKSALFLIYLSGGILAGWASVGWRGGDKTPEPPVPRAAPSVRPRSWSRNDFMAAARGRAEATARAKADPGTRQRADYLKDWTDAEVLAALDESLVDARTLHTEGPEAGKYLLMEYLARDFDAGLAWFSGLSGVHQAAFANTLSQSWPADRAEEGVRFILENSAAFRQIKPWGIVSKGIAAAAARGADAASALVGELRGGKIGLDYQGLITFPPGFDFARFMTSPELREMKADDFKDGLMLSWRASDRESAFQWALEQQGPRQMALFAQPLENMPADSFQWLGGKLDTLPGEKRDEMLAWMGLRLTIFPSDALGLLEGAKDPAVRMEILHRGTQGVFVGRPLQALQIVETLPDPEARVAYLESLEPTAEMSTRRAAYRMDAVDEAQLRKKLGEWNASGERVDAIIARIKTP